MSRLDDMEARLAALEAAGSLAQRLADLEDMLGVSGGAPHEPRVAGTVHCDRCGMDQNPEGFKCSQQKCPLQ
jgi:hypothetical protein